MRIPSTNIKYDFGLILKMSLEKQWYGYSISIGSFKWWFPLFRKSDATNESFAGGFFAFLLLTHILNYHLRKLNVLKMCYQLLWTLIWKQFKQSTFYAFSHLFCARIFKYYIFSFFFPQLFWARIFKKYFFSSFPKLFWARISRWWWMVIPVL